MSLSRRQFASLCAALPLLDAPAAAGADEEKPANPLADEADALLALVKARYGKKLNAEQLKRVRRTIVSNILMARGLKRLKLTNAHEPVTVYGLEQF